MVDVTLEHQTYTFNETEGEISVCAVVVGNKTSCPIDEPEFISISTKSSTASMTVSRPVLTHFYYVFHLY